MTERKLPLSVKGIVFKNNNRRSEVLLLRNERKEWELPGGRIEDNETPESCLVREFKEEPRLEVAIGPCVGSGVLTIVAAQPPSQKSLMTTSCLMDVEPNTMWPSGLCRVAVP